MSSESLLNYIQTEFIKAFSTAKPPQRLAIYANNAVHNLFKALAEIYPLLRQLLGNDYFNLIAHEYIKKYPSNFKNLYHYGEHITSFVRLYPALEHLPYLSEVAEFEWLSHSIFIAEHSKCFSSEKLQLINPELYPNLHFKLNLASKIIAFHYPILQIIELCQGKMDTLNLNEDKLYLLMIRPDLDINLIELSMADYHFLHSLQENKNLQEALDIALHYDGNFNLEIKLAGWIRDKTIVDVI